MRSGGPPPSRSAGGPPVEVTEAGDRVVATVGENDAVEGSVSWISSFEDGEQLDVPVRRVRGVETDDRQLAVGCRQRPGLGVWTLGPVPPTRRQKSVGDARPHADGFDARHEHAVDVLGANQAASGLAAKLIRRGQAADDNEVGAALLGHLPGDPGQDGTATAGSCARLRREGLE